MYIFDTMICWILYLCWSSYFIPHAQAHSHTYAVWNYNERTTEIRTNDDELCNFNKWYFFFTQLLCCFSVTNSWLFSLPCERSIKIQDTHSNEKQHIYIRFTKWFNTESEKQKPVQKYGEIKKNNKYEVFSVFPVYVDFFANGYKMYNWHHLFCEFTFLNLRAGVKLIFLHSLYFPCNLFVFFFNHMNYEGLTIFLLKN